MLSRRFQILEYRFLVPKTKKNMKSKNKITRRTYLDGRNIKVKKKIVWLTFDCMVLCSDIILNNKIEQAVGKAVLD